VTPPTRATHRKALLVAAGVGVQVGAGIAASRWLVGDLGPVGLTFLRYAIGLASLLPLVAWSGGHLWPRQFGLREGARIGVLGVMQFGVLIALLNLGLRHLDAGLGALLFATFPLLTLALATALGYERFDAALAAGVGVSIIGVGIALGVHPPPPGARVAFGAACVLGAALCGAGCSVAYRPLLQRHAMLPMGTFAMAAAVLALAPVALAGGLPARALALDGMQWAVLVAVGVSSGIGYWAWLWALKHTAPTQATAFLALSPVTASLIGALALDEPLGAGLLAGITCIGAGLLVVARRNPSRETGAEVAPP
jgi:drug/metabolite transporter (DMT)-like permease